MRKRLCNGQNVSKESRRPYLLTGSWRCLFYGFFFASLRMERLFSNSFEPKLYAWHRIGTELRNLVFRLTHKIVEMLLDSV